MRSIKAIALALSMLLCATAAQAQQTAIPGLQRALTPLTGTELVPIEQIGPDGFYHTRNVTSSNLANGALLGQSINAASYPTVAAAVAAANAGNLPLTFPAGNYSYVGVTLTLSTPVEFKAGAVLSCSGANVAFANVLIAPRSQIFASGCTPVIPQRLADGVYPEWWGAKPDATGAVGVGTDSTTAFRAALAVGWNKVTIAPGTYRIMGAIRIAAGTTIECGGQENTFIRLDDASGASDMFTVNVGNSIVIDNSVTMTGCNIDRATAQQGSAGALIHIHGTGLVRIRDNTIGSSSTTMAWDGVLLDCGATGAGSVLEMYFEGNVFGAKHDNVEIQCSGTPAQVADIFFEKRNYFWHAQNAAIEAQGAVGWLHIDGNDFDQNPGSAILVNGAGASMNPSYWTLHDNHFEGNGYDVNWTGVGLSILTGNEFVSSSATAGIVCTNCSQIVTSANHYANSAHMVLNGVGAWTESGSYWSTTSGALAGMIQIGPNGTSASNGISIDGGTFAFNATPFVTFTGSSYPASSIALSVTSIQGACYSGANYVAASFAYNCRGAAGQLSGISTLGPIAAAGAVTTSGAVSAAGEIATVGGSITVKTPGAGFYGNLYYSGGWKYYANGGAGAIIPGGDINNTGTKHPIEFWRATNNSSGAAASATPLLAAYFDQYGGYHLIGGVDAPNYSVAGVAGFTGTKTAGSCVLTISSGIITNVTGC